MYDSMLDMVGFLMSFGLLFGFSIWLAIYFLHSAYVLYRESTESKKPSLPPHTPEDKSRDAA